MPELLGKVAERRLTSAVDSIRPLPSEVRIAESDQPPPGKRCDYLLEHRQVLLGLEFTLKTPSRNLSSGDREAVNDLVSVLAEKFRQIYDRFKQYDPGHEKRWLPLVVLVSPSVVRPLLNGEIYQWLQSDGILTPSDPDELMTCHAPEFLELADYATQEGVSIVDAVRDWRDSVLRGDALDLWLIDQGVDRPSARRRAPVLLAWKHRLDVSDRLWGPLGGWRGV